MKRRRKFMLVFCLFIQQGSAEVTFLQLHETCGSNIAIRCSIQGEINPDMTRLWLREGNVIVNGGVSSSPRYREVTNSNYFDLIVTKFTSLDKGTYRCIYGFDSASGLVSCTAQTKNTYAQTRTSSVRTTTTSEIVAQVSEEDDGLSGREIAGIVIGSIIGAAVIVGVIVLIIFKTRR